MRSRRHERRDAVHAGSPPAAAGAAAGGAGLVVADPGRYGDPQLLRGGPADGARAGLAGPLRSALAADARQRDRGRAVVRYLAPAAGGASGLVRPLVVGRRGGDPAGARVGVPARRGPAPAKRRLAAPVASVPAPARQARAGRGGLEHSAGAVAGWRAGGRPRPRRPSSLRGADPAPWPEPAGVRGDHWPGRPAGFPGTSRGAARGGARARPRLVLAVRRRGGLAVALVRAGAGGNHRHPDRVDRRTRYLARPGEQRPVLPAATPGKPPRFVAGAARTGLPGQRQG
ncbi:Uncharacterised protein [Enterobacter cloacae]|nr:Uncharacterised protein [Enterobacter cloacae]